MSVKVRKPKGRRSWCVVIDFHGQRKTIGVGSREAAERVRREIEARLAMGGVESLAPERPSLPTFSEYAQAWLKSVEHERKPSTAGFYGQYLRLYVLPRFGELPLDAISRENVKGFIGDLRTKRLAKNTIRLALTTLRAVLNAAIEDDHLKQNPAQGLGRFVKSEKAKREAASLTTEEVNRLLCAAEMLPSRDHALLLTAVRAGLREGELAGLKWGDIQFGQNESATDRYIINQRSYDRRWSRTMLTPKSRKARRVDMSRQLRQTLLKLRDERLLLTFTEGKSDISDELVFPSEAGTPIEMNNFCERIFKPLTTAGLRSIRFHDLRHHADILVMPTSCTQLAPEWAPHC